MRRVLVPLTVSSGLPPVGSVLHDAAGSTMGTSWSARFALPPAFSGDDARAIADGLQERLDTVVAQMSHWESDSNLSRFNSASAGSWHQLPSEFFDVVSYAFNVAQRTGGAYDPCSGALVNLWGFGARQRYDEANFYAPADSAVQALVARCDRARVTLDTSARRIRQPGGAQLDLSSVAKGYAVDQLARYLDTRGVHHYLAEVGGELRGAGLKPDGQPWWVSLEGVPDSGDTNPVVIALHGLSIATSGDYRRYYQHAGQRASHTLDPRSGYPITNGLASVTVIHSECMAADALSTALTVLGPVDGLRFAEQERLAARFLLRHDGALQEISTTAFKELLQ
jgi:thiamine biosynthesis lipoprotein